jgi:hypothetical protein
MGQNMSVHLQGFLKGNAGIVDSFTGSKGE